MKYFLITWTGSSCYDPAIDQKYIDVWSDENKDTARSNWSGWNRSKTLLNIKEVDKLEYNRKMFELGRIDEQTYAQTNLKDIIAKLIALLQEYRSEIFCENDHDWFVDIDNNNNISIFYWDGDIKKSISFLDFESLMWRELNSIQKS